MTGFSRPYLLARMSYQLPAILRRRFLALPAALMAGMLTSCLGPVPVDADFKAKRGQKVAVITMKAPQASVHHVGNQGLLDMAVNHATSTGSRNQLESYPSQKKLDEVGSQFAKRLNSKGYKATLLNVHPEMKDFNATLAKPNAKKPVQGSMFDTATQKRLWRAPLATIDPGSGVRVEDDNDAGLFRALDTAVQNSSNTLQSNFFDGW